MSVLRTLALLIFCVLGARSQPGRLELLTPSPDHKRSEGARSIAGAPELSRDGKFVLYLSAAPNILPDTPGSTPLNLYMVNRETRETTLISAGLSGEPANENVSGYEFSANARRILFESSASNLVANDTNNQSDIFIRDLDQNKTILANAGAKGEVPAAGAFDSSFSADGNLVTFTSFHAFDPSDTNRNADVFLRDVSAESTEWISHTSIAPFGEQPAISDDGRLIMFSSSDPSSGYYQVLDLHDRTTGLTTRVSDLSDAGVFNPLLSRNGHSLFFVTSNRVIKRYRTDTGAIEQIFTPIDSLPYSNPMASSSDGRTLVYGPFTSSSNKSFEIWREGQPTVAFPNIVDGRQAIFNAETFAHISMSADGKFLLFPCTLIGSPGQLDEDRVYLCDLENLNATLVPHTARPTRSAEPADAVISDDGSIVAFTAPLPGITDGDRPTLNVFAWDRVANTTNLISRSFPTAFENTESGESKLTDASPISDDGAKVVYISNAPARGVADTNRSWDIFVLDRTTGQRQLVSVSHGGTSTGNHPSFNPLISPNGRMVAFVTTSTNIVSPHPSDPWSRGPHLYVRDLQTGVTKLVGFCSMLHPQVALNYDGTRLVFVVSAFRVFDSRPGTGNLQVYVYDWVSESVSLVTYDHAGTSAGSQDTTSAAISRDGRRVAFRTLARNLLSDSFSAGVFVRDLESGQLARVPGPEFNSATINPTVQFSRDGSLLFFGGGSTNLYSWPTSGGAHTLLASNVSEASFSADGRWIALTRRVFPGWPKRNIILRDTVSGVETMICSNVITGSGPLTAIGPGYMRLPGGVGPKISTDGRFVTFQTRANLADKDTNNQTDVYLYDRDRAQLSLISVNAHNEAAGASSRPILSSNGGYVAFCSLSPDLVSHDFNNGADIFAAPLPTTDTDADGIDDTWELANFNSLEIDIDADTDSDGMSNAAEFAAGTNPISPQSRLSLTAISTDSTGNLHLRWNAVPGRAYKIQVRTALVEGAWNDLTAAVVASNIDSSISLPIRTNSSELYLRVVLSE